eukprot:CAMPEP_0196760418 /NCGR_PEP_ID=MMETSP1091-20130531/105203_1 /TAXON_ID=302021 /ORGANISM="Rhodomonas sp., Strain CCMP768" /LENGTH=222 /DNA_ID=CAMNT_0042109303 /DNA_START=91 /DNA_END=759 /DNA_ORIENTATION=+
MVLSEEIAKNISPSSTSMDRETATDAVNDSTMRSVKLQTSQGMVEAKQIGDPDGIPVLTVHGMAKGLVWEWEKAAEALAARGCLVTMPNFHSLHATAPGHSSHATIEAIESLASQLKRGDQGVVLMGKSWGGSIALKFAGSHPALVSKLVLAAPAAATEAAMSEAAAETLLLWTRDDPSFRKAETLATARAGMKQEFHDTGGHRIIADYIPGLIKFVLGVAA